MPNASWPRETNSAERVATDPEWTWPDADLGPVSVRSVSVHETSL